MKTTAVPLLDSLFEPVARSLNPAAARALLNIRANAAARAQVAALAEKCNRGTLSEEERAEYEHYVYAGKVVALLQAKARALLAQETPNSPPS